MEQRVSYFKHLNPIITIGYNIPHLEIVKILLSIFGNIKLNNYFTNNKNNLSIEKIYAYEVKFRLHCMYYGIKCKFTIINCHDLTL